MGILVAYPALGDRSWYHGHTRLKLGGGPEPIIPRHRLRKSLPARVLRRSATKASHNADFGGSTARGGPGRLRPAWLGTFLFLSLPAMILSTGCYSIQNSWLDPTTLGHFAAGATLEIRTSLTLEDTPPGIVGAVHPSAEDLKLIVKEYPISAGDTLAIEINELRERFVPFQAPQVRVSSTGYVNLPVVGRVYAAEKTVPEFEDVLRDRLRELAILMDPEVTVNALFLNKGTYSIFGIGASAATDAPLRAGTFPIRRPDQRILEAINLVGGLNEFVTDIYIFRYDEPFDAIDEVDPVSAPPEEESSRDELQEVQRGPQEQADLIEAVEGGDDSDQPETDQPEAALPEDLLEAESSGPYLWVNGEFVPNPAHAGSEVPPSESRPKPPTFDTATPMVNWARIAGDTTFRIIHIDAMQLRTGDPQGNIYIRAGDVIRIVSGEIGVYYVMGQVNRVGPFAFNSESITLKKAIAGAGGLSALAWPDRCTVYRRVGQREQMIQVNLDRVFAGKDPDFLIRRGDIINVGTHPFAPFLQRIRQATLPTVTSTLGYSFTYARNFADIDSFSSKVNPANQPDRFPNLFP